MKNPSLHIPVCLLLTVLTTCVCAQKKQLFNSLEKSAEKITETKGPYNFYNFKFDVHNPEHVRIMDNPTEEELFGYANQLELAAKDPLLNE